MFQYQPSRQSFCYLRRFSYLSFLSKDFTKKRRMSSAPLPDLNNLPRKNLSGCFGAFLENKSRIFQTNLAHFEFTICADEQRRSLSKQADENRQRKAQIQLWSAPQCAFVCDKYLRKTGIFIRFNNLRLRSPKKFDLRFCVSVSSRNTVKLWFKKKRGCVYWKFSSKQMRIECNNG